jgi:hypothetical protein
MPAANASLLAFFGAAAVLSNILFSRLRERFHTQPTALLFDAGQLFQPAGVSLVPGRVPEEAGRVAGARFVAVRRHGLAHSDADLPGHARALGAQLGALASRRNVHPGLYGKFHAGQRCVGGRRAQQGIPMAFVGAAAVLLLGLIALRGFVIVDPGRANLSPSHHWPDPVMAVEPSPEEGPVLIMVEYDIALEEADAFMAAMQPVRRMSCATALCVGICFKTPLSPRAGWKRSWWNRGTNICVNTLASRTPTAKLKPSRGLIIVDRAAHASRTSSHIMPAPRVMIWMKTVTMSSFAVEYSSR